jgi:hypothetical protein
VGSLASSLRYLLADVIGDDDATLPYLPEGLPEGAAPVVSEGIHLLVDYQGPSYADLYVQRLKRFAGRREVDGPLFCAIARLLAERMSYEDAIRIAQLKLSELEAGGAASDEVLPFRLDELIGALPAAAAEPVLEGLTMVGWLRKRVKIRFSGRTRWGIRRLRLEAALRRWRLFSVRYAEERTWVERWLHMVNRALAKQPAAARAIVDTAGMVKGFGEPYRQGLADWHAIIDGLAKPTFDGILPLSDLAAAVAEARTATMPDPRQAALKRTIAQIRARALGADVTPAAG